MGSELFIVVQRTIEHCRIYYCLRCWTVAQAPVLCALIYYVDLTQNRRAGTALGLHYDDWRLRV